MRINTILATALCAAGATTGASALAATLQPNSSSAQGKAVVSAAAAQDVVEFSIYLPLRGRAQLETLLAQLHDQTSAQYHQWLQPADFLAQYGPRPADIAAVKDALTLRGLTIVSTNAHGLRVRGTAATVAQALVTSLQKVTTHGHTRFQTPTAPVIPGELAGIEMHVVGLATVPERHVHAHVLGKLPAASGDNRYGPTGPYWFTDLKQAYDYPAYSASVDGSSVNVAVLMSDQIFSGDVQAMFDHEKFTALTGTAAPGVITKLIDGGGVIGGGGTFEASLDVQQVLGGAPGAKVTLVSIPDLSDDHILDGYQYIVDSNRYDIVNSSFGGCELFYTAAYNGGTDFTDLLQAQHEMFLQGNAQGITFVASSGDEAGLECPSLSYLAGASGTFVPSVSTPADDPAVTAVGGGNLVTTTSTTSLKSAYVRESAFSDPETLADGSDPYGTGGSLSGGRWGAGGGVSVVFKKPLYQRLANTAGGRWRTIPDVGMQVGGCPGSVDPSLCSPDDSAVVTAVDVADPVNGGFFGVIGTSVSSPEFVGALALFEQQLGRKNHRLGNANYYLYAVGALQTLAGGIRAPAELQFFHRNDPGYNGVVYDDFPSYNYNYVYGNGTPDVRKLFNMTAYKAAGVPQTATNP